MALSKRIELGNGVTVCYHRVAEVRIVTNVSAEITVISYTSMAKRAEEQAALAAEEPMDVYMEAAYYEAPYEQGMSVDGAYAWLKANVPGFAGASDVLEEGQEPGEGVRNDAV